MMFILLLFSFLFANEDHYKPAARWLLELNNGNTDCLTAWAKEKESERQDLMIKKLPLGNWFVVEATDEDANIIAALPCVKQLLEDKKIQWRDKEPNDPGFINQADMELIGMPQAWDIATGGVTANGDTIVIALIDTGFQPDHEDLEENIWKNKDEVPNDDEDNDGNGYTDDYVGINISTGDDVHLPLLHHGTSVAGIVGAKGNNGIGIAGVNWDIKLMLVSGADFESELIEAYEYVYQMRRKYRLTNGAEGAFVVATNLSGGVNNAWAADHPLWCQMYDKLGEEGILNVTAAPNHGNSVDLVGDMPTTCTSVFMITVTNVDLSDVILANAGFGQTSIDIGAPGHGTVTTNGNNQYRDFPGTSAATPHVTGVIGLIYNAACVTLLENINSNPSAMAITVRDIILESGTDNNSLQDLTVTGKRLQADAALNRTISLCGSTPSDAVKISSVRANPPFGGYAQVYFEVEGDTSTAFFELISVNGSRIQTFNISAMEFEQGYIQFNTLPLPAGIYFISLRNKKEKAVGKFFVK